MRALLISLALLGGAFGARADETSDIRSVISDQIAAFEAEDLETAFSFASPMIREMFGDPERFGRMVREGYPMVWRPGDVRFTTLGVVDGRKVQSVMMTDRAGVLHIVDYDMVLLENGWRINGVHVRKAPDAGA